MVTKCAWCQKIMKAGNGGPDEEISHGMCEECAKGVREEIAKLKVEE